MRWGYRWVFLSSIPFFTIITDSDLVHFDTWRNKEVNRLTSSRSIPVILPGFPSLLRADPPGWWRWLSSIVCQEASQDSRGQLSPLTRRPQLFSGPFYHQRVDFFTVGFTLVWKNIFVASHWERPEWSCSGERGEREERNNPCWSDWARSELCNLVPQSRHVEGTQHYERHTSRGPQK